MPPPLPVAAASFAAADALRAKCAERVLGAGGVSAGDKTTERYNSDDTIRNLSKNNIEKNTSTIYEKTDMANLASFVAAEYRRGMHSNLQVTGTSRLTSLAAPAMRLLLYFYKWWNYSTTLCPRWY